MVELPTGFVGAIAVSSSRRHGMAAAVSRRSVRMHAKRRGKGKGKKDPTPAPDKMIGNKNVPPMAPEEIKPKAENEIPPAKAETEIEPATTETEIRPAKAENDIQPAKAETEIQPKTAEDEIKPPTAEDTIKPEMAAEVAGPAFAFQGPLSPESYVADEPEEEEVQSRPVARRRRRQRRSKKSTAASEEAPEKPKELTEEESMVLDANLKKLTESFELDKETLREQMEINPDFVIAKKQERREYDLTAAVIGAGAESSEFGYVLPYLQTGHMVGLLVILLCANVYYPGFPLTQLPEQIREIIRKLAFVTFFVNSVLCIQAYKDAKARNQPWAFWVVKVFLLGGLALNELQVNIPEVSEKPKGRS